MSRAKERVKVAKEAVSTEVIEQLEIGDVEYGAIPEHLRPREYGRKFTTQLPLRLLIRLDQVRSDINPSTGALRDSIALGDLINQIDVARLTHHSLSEYIEFVNHVWRSDYSIDACPMDDEGFYYLVMAGHSRTEAIFQIEAVKAKEALEQGFNTDPGSAMIWSKIINNPSPEEIIALQLDENIYKMPSEERRAMAIVETYMFGVDKGKWSTKAKFLKLAGKKFSKEALDNALFFVGLDPIHRDLVFCGAVKYGPAIEVARSIELFQKYTAAKYLKTSVEEIPVEKHEEFEDYVRQWCGKELGYIQTKHLNVTAARKRYESLRTSWQRFFAETVDTGQSDQVLFDDSSFMAEQQRSEWAHARDKLKRDYASIMYDLAPERLGAAAVAISLHAQIHADPEITAGVQKVLTDRMQVFAQNTGRLITEKAAAVAQGFFE